MSVGTNYFNPRKEYWEPIPSKNFERLGTHQLTGRVAKYVAKKMGEVLSRNEHLDKVVLYRRHSKLEYKVGLHFKQEVDEKNIILEIGKMQHYKGKWTINFEGKEKPDNVHYITVTEMKT